MTEQELKVLREKTTKAKRVNRAYAWAVSPAYAYEVEALLDYVDFLKENPVVPKDWQLVPKHCTIGMESAGGHAGPYVVEQYKAMLDAAPSYKKDTTE